jgi:hypothetical protein
MNLDVQIVAPGSGMCYSLWEKNRRGEAMEFTEKARMRLEHWLSHNEHHLTEYRGFAEQLENAGQRESAAHIREMMDHTVRSTECMRKALRALIS